jgi:hypothetical protein
MTDNETTPREVNAIFHHHVIGTKSGPTVTAVAEDMGWPEITVYKTLSGDLPIKAEDFHRFYHACGRPIDALNYLVRRCEPGMYLRSRNVGEVNGRFDDELAELHITIGKFYEMSERYLADQIMDEEERAALRAMVANFRPVIDRLDAEIDVHGKSFERGGKNG